MYPVLSRPRPRRRLKPAILLLASAIAALAQIGLPGQYPGQYPPGQYPPGHYPPGQNPNGGSSPSGSSRRESSRSESRQTQQNFSGAIRKADAKSIELELEDTRILTIQVSDTTTKPSKDLKRGDGIDVVTTQDKDGVFQAVSIALNASMNRKMAPLDQVDDPGPSGQQQQQPQEEQRTGPPPTIMVHPDQSASDGDAPPKLKRGVPDRVTDERKIDQTSASSTVASATDGQSRRVAETVPPRMPAAPPPNPRMALVERAREVASTFLDGLPNYVCQELTTRYFSETRTPSWNVIDTIGAEVVFESGKESYRNITINGKASKKPPEESGAWSTGEFGTILAEIYWPGSAAKFKFVEDASIIHHPSSVYDFTVERERSSWKVSVPGQYIMPAYKGSVWIDKDGAHTLRIEMQGRDIPEEFPLITVETAVDYDYITLGMPEKFLLPVHAEVLSCKRGSNECERNSIEFRNYHKFTGESVIKFGDSQK
jgi:hypothetical protein